LQESIPSPDVGSTAKSSQPELVLAQSTDVDPGALADQFVIIRKSAMKPTESVAKDNLERAKQHAAQYVMAHRKAHPFCACKPRAHFIYLNGVSSNSPVDTPEHSGLAELKHDLREIKESGERRKVALLILQADGFSTNPMAFRAFFGPFVCPIIHVCMRLFTGVAKAPVLDSVTAINDLEQGRTDDCFCQDIIRRWVDIAFNKDL
jgi:hypothetical protein